MTDDEKIEIAEEYLSEMNTGAHYDDFYHPAIRIVIAMARERSTYRDALAKIAPDARQYKGTVYQVCRTCDGRSLAVDFDEIVHADDCVWERARRIVAGRPDEQ